MNYVPDMPGKIEEHPITFCDVCNGDLYEGDGVYKVENDIICSSECLENYFEGFKQTLERGGK